MSFLNRLFRRDGAASSSVSVVDNRPARRDGWANLATGLGTSRDKRTYNAIYRELDILDEECESLFDSNDLCRKVIEKLPSEALRHGVTLNGVDPDDSQRILSVAERLGVMDKVLEARCWGRLFGGGAILLGVQGGGNPLEPLDDERVTGLSFLEVLDKRDLVPERWYMDPAQSNFGRVELWRINPAASVGMQLNTVVHESWLVMFGGARTTRREKIRRAGWDMSILQSARTALADADGNWASVCHLMTDLSQAVFKLRGLVDLIAAKEEDAVKTRLELIETGRAVCRAVLLDADNGEEFERKATPLDKVPELIDRTWQRVAAAFDMPVTELIGISSAGFQASGENDMRKWYNSVAVERRYLKPMLERLLRFIARGEGVDATDLCVEFPSLYQPSAKETSEARLNDAKADEIRIRTRMLTPMEITQSRWGRGEYGENIALDPAITEREAPAPTAIPTAKEPGTDVHADPKSTDGAIPAPREK